MSNDRLNVKVVSNQNSVELTKSENKVVVTDKKQDTAVNVTQKETAVVTIVSKGPKGDKGDTGDIGTTITNQIATGSITASVNIGADTFRVQSGSSTFLYISSSGNVGIGTITPQTQLHISGGITSTYLTASYIDINTTAGITQPIEGRLSWNNTDGTLDIGLKGGNIELQVGQEEVVQVVNKTDANLLKSEYKVARIRRTDEGGAQGQRLAIKLSQANNDPNSVDTLGLVAENIDNNQEGYIITSGLVRDINTTGTLQGETWNDGDVLYLSPTTAGALTNIKPIAPNHTIIVGFVVYSHNNQGKIFVKVDNGYEIDELHNVRIITSSLSSGDLLVYSGSVWINSKELSGSYGLTGSLTTTGDITTQNLIVANITASENIRIGRTKSIGGNNFGTYNPILTYWNDGVSDAVQSASFGFRGSAYMDSIAYPDIFGFGTNDLRFFASTNGIATPTEIIRVVGSTGFVGIGETSPSAKLEIKGSGATSATTALRVENSSATSLLTILNDGTSAFNTSHLYVSSSGNVGIGTTSPSAQLHISGSATTPLRIQNPATTLMQISSSVANSGSIVFFGTTPTAAGLDLEIQSNGAANGGQVRIAGNGTQWDFGSVSAVARGGTGNSEMFSATMTGTSTTLVQNPVRIQFNANQSSAGGGGYTVLRLNATHASTAGTGSKLLQTWEFGGVAQSVMDISGSLGIGTGSAPSARLFISGANNQSLLQVSSPTNANILFVSGSGNIGIGTTNPIVKLHISQSSGIFQRVDINNANADGVNATTQYYTNAGATADLFGATSFRLQGGTTDAFKQFQVYIANLTSPRFIINGSGNVGINTTSPNARLHISGANNEALLIVSSSTAPSALFVSGSGNVGIGTSTPSTTLNVNGTTLLQGGQTTVRGSGATSATTTLLVQNSTPTNLMTILDNGQFTYTTPTIILPASQSAYTISPVISASNVVGGQYYGVNITPTFFQTTGSQTETAFRVAATFTQSSAAATSGSNIIADFGATSVGSQLTVTDITSGSIYMVNDVSGLPIIEANSGWDVNIYNFPNIVFRKSGNNIELGVQSNTGSVLTFYADTILNEGYGFTYRTTQVSGSTSGAVTSSLWNITFGSVSSSVYVTAVVTGYDTASRDTITGDVKATIRYRSGVASIVGTNQSFSNTDNSGVSFNVVAGGTSGSLRVFGTGSRTYQWGATVTTQMI